MLFEVVSMSRCHMIDLFITQVTMATGGPTWPTWFCQEPPTLKRVAHTSTLRAESNRPGADIHDCVSLKWLLPHVRITKLHCYCKHSVLCIGRARAQFG